MKHSHTLKLIYASLFAALTFVGTYALCISLPFGYFNFGDCFVLLAAWTLGGPYAIIAAGIGSALSDLLLGYGIYAPITFIIKALMVLIAYVIARLGKEKHLTASKILGACAAEIFMVAGYYLFESILYGFTAALASVVGNLLQGAVAIVSSLVIIITLDTTGITKRINALSGENK